MKDDRGVRSGHAAVQPVRRPVRQGQAEASGSNNLAQDGQGKKVKQGAHHIGLFADEIRANSDITPNITDRLMVPEGNLSAMRTSVN